QIATSTEGVRNAVDNLTVKTGQAGDGCSSARQLRRALRSRDRDDDCCSRSRLGGDGNVAAELACALAHAANSEGGRLAQIILGQSDAIIANPQNERVIVR